jgi:transketolase C-terminal domain/subunit
MTVVLNPVDLHAAARSRSAELQATGSRLVYLGDADPPPDPEQLAAFAPVVAPADDRELAAMLPWLGTQPTSPLVLLGGPRVLQVHAPGFGFRPEKGEVLLRGGDVCVLASGAQVGEALAAAMDLHSQALGARVVALSCLDPLDEALVARSAERCPALLVAEATPPAGVRGLHQRVTELLSGRHVATVAPVPAPTPGSDAGADAPDEPGPYGPSARDIRAAATRLRRGGGGDPAGAGGAG